VGTERSEGADDQAARRAALYESLVEGAFEFVCTFGTDGVIAYANRSSETILGWTPEQMIGRHVVEFVHPDELERVALAVSQQGEHGAPLGTTSFRLATADGGWASVDLTAADVSDGVDDFMAVYCRPADYQHATDEVMYQLLRGAPVADTLAPVLDVFAWRLNGTHIAIAWFDERAGHQVVSTGLPVSLTGAEASPGEAWATARDRFEAVHDPAQEMLDPARAAAAAELGLGACWIEPVADARSGVPALVTAWGKLGGRAPEGHAYGMSVAKNFVELILRWSQQVSRLEHAALHDSLTGLANREAFFDRLAAVDGGGALLYCDLDRFKPVNDELGHVAGDELLRLVADRLAACAAEGQMVARLGGDEFAVLCPGATEADAQRLADAIRAAVSQPFDLAGTSVEIGISIGIAHASSGLGDATLEEADRDLYRDKGTRRRRATD
jgi:diguanylate cyclase (GGDEF)-like protein/PAS domain S-box-containing protein